MVSKLCLGSEMAPKFVISGGPLDLGGEGSRAQAPCFLGSHTAQDTRAPVLVHGRLDVFDGAFLHGQIMKGSTHINVAR